MYDSILFPTDGSDGATAVFDHVLDIATQHGATVQVLHVADTTALSITRAGGEVIDAFEEEGERLVEERAARADSRGVPVVTDVYQGGVAETIAAYAGEYDSDVIAMPTRGRTGLAQAVLGSVTERVLRRSDTPVLVLPPDGEAEYPYRDILVPTDGSDPSAEALDAGAAVANALGATLHVLTVVDMRRPGVDIRSEAGMDGLEQRANALVEEATARARDAGVDSVVGHVASGHDIAGGITGAVETHDADLVVMGTHGRSGLDRFLLGSVTERTVRTAPVPVLAVPDAGTDESAE